MRNSTKMAGYFDDRRKKMKKKKKKCDTPVLEGIIKILTRSPFEQFILTFASIRFTKKVSSFSVFSFFVY